MAGERWPLAVSLSGGVGYALALEVVQGPSIARVGAHEPLLGGLDGGLQQSAAGFARQEIDGGQAAMQGKRGVDGGAQARASR